MGGKDCSLKWMIPVKPNNKDNLVLEREISIAYLNDLKISDVLDNMPVSTRSRSRSRLESNAYLGTVDFTELRSAVVSKDFETSTNRSYELL